MGQSAPTPSHSGGSEVRGVEPGGVAGVVDHGSAHAAPELLEPSGTGSAPAMTRGSVQYSWWEPRSSLTQSASGSQNGPASSPTYRAPARARRWSRVAPPAPQPTIDHVHLVALVVPAHVGSQAMVGSLWPGGQQPGRFVAGPDVRVAEPAHSAPHRHRVPLVLPASVRLMGPLAVLAVRPRHRVAASISGAPTPPAGRCRGSCSPAGRRARRSRSRSMPTGGSRRPWRCSGSTGSRGGRR